MSPEWPPGPGPGPGRRPGPGHFRKARLLVVHHASPPVRRLLCSCDLQGPKLGGRWFFTQCWLDACSSCLLHTLLFRTGCTALCCMACMLLCCPCMCTTSSGTHDVYAEHCSVPIGCCNSVKPPEVANGAALAVCTSSASRVAEDSAVHYASIVHNLAVCKVDYCAA